MKCPFKILIFTLPILFLAFQTSPAKAQVTAFPGAFGFGAMATGGRGGAVYHVTNLNDSGTGSFRDAVSAGNRIIVFDVGGYVVLLSAVSVSSNLSIEGQTAPGGGIGLMAAEISLSGKSNIIIRNVRFRQGNEDPDTGKSALNMGTGNNIILDHCSFEYGQFDSVDAVGTTNFTVQNCIIANPIGQQFGAHVEVGPDTFYRNLWVSAHNRQPLAKSDTQYINNIIYNFEAAYTTADTGGVFSHDIVGNYFITGPSTTNPADAYFQFDSNQSVYAVGNYMDSNKDGVLNGSPYNTVGGGVTVLTAPWSSTTSSIPTLSADPTSVCQTGVFPSVIESCGAFPRDAVDNFVLGNVTSLGLTGTLYTNQANTGLANNGYGTLAAGTPFADTGGDGIADYWAQANGISTTNAAAGTAAYGTTGYTNLEAYANSLVLPAPWSAVDLPSTPIRGASSYNTFTNQWLLTGSGIASSSAITQGQFVSQPWTADGTLSAELLGITGSTAQGGLMLRSTGSAGTAYVALVQGTGTLSFIWQSAGGSVQSIQVAQTALPLYLEIVGSAGSYSGYYSTNGTTYTLLDKVTVSLGTGIQAGLVLASGSATALGTASFTNLGITLSACSTPTATPTSGGASPTPTSSRTPTASSTATRTSTWTATVTPTSTSTRASTSTATALATSTPSNITTATTTVTVTRTNSSTPTFTPTATPSNTAMRTPTATPTFSATNSPTSPATTTVSSTRTATSSSTATASTTDTATGIPTATLTSTAISTSTATSSLSPTGTMTPTESSTSTQTSTSSMTLTSTSSPTVTYSDTITSSPTPSRTPTSQPPTETSTATASATDSLTASSTKTASSTATFSSTITNTQTVSASPTRTSTSTATRTSTSSSTVTFTSTASMTPTLSGTATSTATGTSTPADSLTPTHTPTPQATVIIYPNPATGPGPVTLQISLSSPASKVIIDVFTTAFRKANMITLLNVPAGTTDLALPLTDQEGVPLANGLYYVIVQTPQGRFIVKLLVLR